MVKNLFINNDNEEERINQIKYYEYEVYAQGYQYLAGLDEVGRGPLAGPVVAAAVILPRDFNVPGIKDSKLLTNKKRVVLAAEIKKHALDWSIAMVSPAFIDRYNILQATREAMKTAVQTLTQVPDFLLIDAVTIPDIPIKQLSIIKGDQLSISIAAASIIAKVARDNCMRSYDKLYPLYEFARHKGYCTRQHQELLQKYGPCPIHRVSFSPVKIIVDGGVNGEQLCLFK